MAEEAKVAAIRAQAEGGDARAMSKLGIAYRDGERGLKQDKKQAFTWFKQAADLQDPTALTSCGAAYLNAHGVERSISRGVSMVTMAAERGSEHACGILGRANAEGRHGFDQDPQEATRWYRQMQTCGIRNASEAGRERAAVWLREHP